LFHNACWREIRSTFHRLDLFGFGAGRLNSRTNRKAARQHMADKGGLRITDSYPAVQSPAFIPSKKLRDYELLIRLIPGKVKGDSGPACVEEN